MSDDPVVDVLPSTSGGGPASPEGGGEGCRPASVGPDTAAAGPGSTAASPPPPPPPTAWGALVRRVHANKISLHAPSPLVETETSGAPFPDDPAAPPAAPPPPPARSSADRFKAAGLAVRAGVRARRAAAEASAAAAAAAAEAAGVASDDVIGEIHFSGGSARFIQRVQSRNTIPESVAAAAAAAAAAAVAH